jgi:hypothetical protein
MTKVVRPSSVKFSTLLLALWACDRTPEAKPDSATLEQRPPAARPAPAAASAAPASNADYRLPARSRVVAIGDIHGDLAAMRRALRLAGAIDSDDRWIGKDLAVVQTGDQVDRGDQDREVLDVLEKLEKEAAALGSALYVLNGNHELMNAGFDFRYVSQRSFESFSDLASRAPAVAGRLPVEARGRAAAFAPGAPYALELAKHLTVAMVGDSLFAHGGVLPAHVDYGLSRINREAQSFLAGKLPQLPAAVAGEDAPVWTRLYGGPSVDGATCEVLGRVLRDVGAKRLVVGHTVQKNGISPACQDRLFRIDIGLSAYYGGNQTQVLEIGPGGARILRDARPEGAPDKRSGPRNSALHSAP